MKNIIILVGALWLSGCVTLPKLPTKQQMPESLLPKEHPVKITTDQEAKDNTDAHTNENFYRKTKEKPEVSSAPVGKVKVKEIPDHKRDVMSLKYIKNPKAKPIKNTNIYKPLMGYIGGNSNDIISLMGTPTRERNDPKVRVWQYKYMLEGRACWVDVYLYPDKGKYQAQYIELRGIKMSEHTRRKCFATKYKAD